MNPFDHERLDDVIHSRIRLAVMVLLGTVDHAEFMYLKKQVNTSNGNLGAHLGKLEAAGYVSVKKQFVDQKPVSYYRLTAPGRTALQEYFKRLESLLDAGR